MGCDIHLYIEYKDKNPRFDGHNPIWRSFGQRINPSRNYALFALMAGVRNYDNELPVLFPERGMPDDAAYYAAYDNKLYISENPIEERDVKPEKAKQWVDNGSSTYINNRDGNPTWVTNPDWHSHSCLTTGEFDGILKKYLEVETGWHKERVEKHNKKVKERNIQPGSWAYDPPMPIFEPEYQAVLASMKQFEELGYDARIVFWFDN